MLLGSKNVFFPVDVLHWHQHDVSASSGVALNLLHLGEKLFPFLGHSSESFGRRMSSSG